jgi:hypothetical protein
VKAHVAVFVLLGVLGARPLPAQAPRTVEAEAEVSRARFRSTAPDGTDALSGLVLGIRARLTGTLIGAEASYAQGRLTAAAGSGPSRSLANGSVFLTTRPKPWLTLKAGPELRAYAAPGGTERWVLWEFRARAEAPIVSAQLTLRAHVELWSALAASVNADPGASGARGGQAGMVMRLPRSRVWLRLSYAVDEERMKSGARTEALETVALTVGLGGR